MGPISADRLIHFTKKVEGKRLTTLARTKGFTIALVPAGIEITPLSTSTPRTVPFSRIQSVCEEFNRSKSLRPGDYKTITVDASYLLTLVKLMIDDGH
jgi:hypothetical protein